MLVQVGEGNLFLLLILTAFICIILGMGMPTTAIYFLLAVLATQPLIDLGVEPLAAHLFVLYFGLMSMITPPVALAAFTAAKLAETGPMSTAWSACQFGWPAFICTFPVRTSAQPYYGGRQLRYCDCIFNCNCWYLVYIRRIYWLPYKFPFSHTSLLLRHWRVILTATLTSVHSGLYF